MKEGRTTAGSRGGVEEIRWVEVKVVGRTSSGQAQETKTRQRPGNTADDQPR
jgi:hypothetical protein